MNREDLKMKEETPDEAHGMSLGCSCALSHMRCAQASSL